MNPYLIPFTDHSNANLQLFCFPYAGGGASIFRKLKNFIPPEIELIGVQYPGRESLYKEHAIKDMDELVLTLFNAISNNLNKPSVFFGYSLGAIVAFELAVKLQQHNLPLPKLIIIAASRAPEEIAADDSLKIAAASPKAALDKLLFYGGTPDAILNDQQILDFFVRILQADFSLFASYQLNVNAQLPCPLTVLYGEQEPENSLQQANQWKKYTSSQFQVYSVPGKHFFINESTDKMMNIIVNTCEKLHPPLS